MNDVFVRYSKELPYTVHGMVIMDENSDYNVYINSRLSCVEQEKAIEHELLHIKNGDFDNDSAVSIERVEERAKKR